MNPFKYGETVNGENFCRRPELSRTLRGYVEAGQNVVIQGERRMGKTSLVLETVRGMKGMRYSTQTCSAFATPPTSADGSRPHLHDSRIPPDSSKRCSTHFRV